jgi:hypothetical protein
MKNGGSMNFGNVVVVDSFIVIQDTRTGRYAAG